MGRVRWIVLFIFFGLCVGWLATKGWREKDPDVFGESPPRLVREFEGTVLDGGVPVAGATVQLWEDADDGFEAATLSLTDGSFHLDWEPTATTRLDRLFLAAAHHGRRSAVTRVRAGGTTVRLEPMVTSEGRVVDFEGKPVAQAKIQCSLRHGASSESEAAP